MLAAAAAARAPVKLFLLSSCTRQRHTYSSRVVRNTGSQACTAQFTLRVDSRVVQWPACLLGNGANKMHVAMC